MKKTYDQLRIELEALDKKLLISATNYQKYIKKYKAYKQKMFDIRESILSQIEEAARQELTEDLNGTKKKETG